MSNQSALTQSQAIDARHARRRSSVGMRSPAQVAEQLREDAIMFPSFDPGEIAHRMDGVELWGDHDASEVLVLGPAGNGCWRAKTLDGYGRLDQFLSDLTGSHIIFVLGIAYQCTLTIAAADLRAMLEAIQPQAGILDAALDGHVMDHSVGVQAALAAAHLRGKLAAVQSRGAAIGRVSNAWGCEDWVATHADPTLGRAEGAMHHAAALYRAARAEGHYFEVATFVAALNQVLTGGQLVER